MKETTYTDKCPVHGQKITTKRTQNIRISRTKNTYTGPQYYCARCRAYYIIINELSSDFKAKTTAPSGLPIHVIGKQKTVDSRDKAPKTAVKKQANKNITRNIKDGKIEINIIPEGSKLPKKCDSCNSATCGLMYTIKDKTGKSKKLGGKECPVCHRKFYSEKIYNEHADCFIVKEADQIPVSSNKAEHSDNSSIIQTTKEKKKQRKNYATECPVHGIALRTPILWEEKIPIFSCPQCNKFYVHMDTCEYGKIVGKFKGKSIYNSPINFCEGNEPPVRENQEKIEDYPAETDIKALNYDEHKEDDLKDDNSTRNVIVFTHEDDFGRKYDFSELRAFLNL